MIFTCASQLFRWAATTVPQAGRYAQWRYGPDICGAAQLCGCDMAAGQQGEQQQPWGVSSRLQGRHTRSSGRRRQQTGAIVLPIMASRHPHLGDRMSAELGELEARGRRAAAAPLQDQHWCVVRLLLLVVGHQRGPDEDGVGPEPREGVDVQAAVGLVRWNDDLQTKEGHRARMRTQQESGGHTYRHSNIDLYGRRDLPQQNRQNRRRQHHHPPPPPLPPPHHPRNPSW